MPTSNGLPVSNIVNVDVVLSPVAAGLRDFGSLLILGSSNVIDTTQRIQQFADIAEVAASFGTSAPEYLAAVLYFGQDPKPETLYIGRWAQTATAAILHGGTLTSTQQADIASFTAVTTGKLTVTIDGVAKAMTAIDFSAAGNLNAVAAVINTKLGVDGSCTWDAVNGRFNITSATTGATSTLSFAATVAADQNVSALMKFRSTDGGSVVNGIAAESMAASVAILLNQSSAWYGLQMAAAGIVSNDYMAAAALIEAAVPVRIFGITTQDADTLNIANTSNLAYLLKTAAYKRTFVQYSSSNAYASASIFGRAFTVNFQGSNTTITIKFKQEPGVTSETLTQSQAAALDFFNCNVFVKYNNDTAIIQQGVMSNGFFFDEVHGTDWLQDDVQTAIYNLLYTSPKIPQTDAGIGVLLTVVSQRCAQAVVNGLVAPGVWNAPGFGTLKQFDTLTAGYYVYAAPIATQSQASREAREAPVIQAAIKLAGAVHFVDCIINVNR